MSQVTKLAPNKIAQTLHGTIYAYIDPPGTTPVCMDSGLPVPDRSRLGLELDPLRSGCRRSASRPEALPDRAARMLGDAVYGRDKDRSSMGRKPPEAAWVQWVLWIQVANERSLELFRASKVT